MVTQVEQTIKERLSRIIKKRPEKSIPRSCAISKPCDLCLNHKGIQLSSDSAFVTARLCNCVSACDLCGGSCMRPLEQDQSLALAPCTSPSPKKIAGIINEARIPARYIDADFSRFEGFSASDRSQKTTIANWMKSLKPGQSSGLLLSGPVGIGKSWLLAAIAKQLAMQGVTVRYADFFQLIHELREAYASDQADRSSLRPLQTVDVLIVDELGKGRNTEWELSVADSLISDRYNGNKCIIAATNYPLRGQAEVYQKQIDYLRSESSTNQMNAATFEPLAHRIGSRMYSRLSENCICMEISGTDRRRR